MFYLIKCVISEASAGAGKLKARFESMAKASDEENRKKVEEERARREARESREREEAKRRQQVWWGSASGWDELSEWKSGI